MNTFDVIVTWPINCDYPLWRQFIRDNRHRFNEIIIAFHNTNLNIDFRLFIASSMFPDYVHFLDARTPKPDEDWRSVAINQSLIHSYNSEWIWFTEQDFIIDDPGFWDEVSENSKKYDIMAVFQADRMHPCCIFIKRQLLQKTSRNFGIIPNVADHFSIIQREIEALQVPIYHLEKGYKHLNGLSHNISLLEQGQAPNYHLDDLKIWFEACKKVKVPIDERFLLLERSIGIPYSTAK